MDRSGRVATYVAVAGALCEARSVLLLRITSSGSASCEFAAGFDRTPPDPERILALYRPTGGDDALLVSRLPGLTEAPPSAADRPGTDHWAGWRYCAIGLRDPSGRRVGLLCALWPAGHEPALSEAARQALRALALAGASWLAAEQAQDALPHLLLEHMSECAWLCDSQGRLLWCNPAFAACLGWGPEGEAFVARWHHAGARAELVPAVTRDGRTGWFATRKRAVRHETRPASLGLATERTAQVQAQLDLARLREQPAPPRLLALLKSAASCLGSAQQSVPKPRIEAAPGHGWMTARCESRLLENVLLDLALIQAGQPEAGALGIVLSRSADADHAVLSVSLPGTLPPATLSGVDPLLALPMLHALAREGARVEIEAASSLRILLPLLAPAAGEDSALKGARILVVDDEPVVRMLVVDLLRERGHLVQEAEDAFIAMSTLQEAAELDLMITDIGLPGGFDGSTLARRARQIRPELPILFITGYAFGTNNDITLEPGIPVLTKPFTLGTLSARIAELLPGRSRQALTPSVE